MNELGSKRPKINPAFRTDVQNSVLCWLATVGADGTPNVTPKELFCCHGDDRIVVADIASTISVRNIINHPKVCVSFVDVFRQRGFKIVGSASIVAPEEVEFAQLGAELLRMAGGDFPIRHVISIGIERVSRIWAPSYSLFPERTEQERMQSAYSAYGVTPIER
ncbi:putative pyridoxine 5'-phosphate oxidase superfamily flavin-nucleotide-binding protein [Pseudorhizobium tarimense]|uniref:Pyridoxine 5'-phosphate oxidase superfamily flavin-nucleotide-binding protein n=1 Tax=Pseudorhizobium tarimense TaxID=1079109 RepID=A0ABV2HDH7_9HYPH|nr:pyridoxamine 5'-phosphate oxidase family protein [Pseudorhizobium tarimense]MCJ8521612.1 pyridoxamine 5'-phosphate oxidase family protein [Pseudorhizobium tarimense]